MKHINLDELKLKSVWHFNKNFEKWQIENSETSEFFFQSFLLLSCRFWVLRQNRKVGREKVRNKIPRFPNFRPGLQNTSFSLTTFSLPKVKSYKPLINPFKNVSVRLLQIDVKCLLI